MTQIRGTTPENYAAARAAGRELLDAALQRSRTLSIAATVAGPLVKLLQGRKGGNPPPLTSKRAVRKQPKGSQTGSTPVGYRRPAPPSAGRAGKGGRYHG